MESKFKERTMNSRIVIAAGVLLIAFVWNLQLLYPLISQFPKTAIMYTEHRVM